METPRSSTVDKSQIEILNQLIDDEKGQYRVRAGQRVHYLTIDGHVYDEDTMCRPYLLIPALPDFPNGDWTRMHITRSGNGSLQSHVDSEPLPAMSEPGHVAKVDILALPIIHRYSARIKEVTFQGRPAITKIACWPWEIGHMSTEAQAYHTIQEHRKPDEPPLAPAVLGHLIENGRTMGLLLEKVEGEFPDVNDLLACTAAVRRLHAIGLIHGDVNKYNFLIDRSTDQVRMVDFEHTEPWEEEVAELELNILQQMLEEDTGRGHHARV